MSAVLALTTAAGCGALHEAPVSNATANRDAAAIQRADTYRHTTAPAVRGGATAKKTPKAGGSETSANGDADVPGWVTAVNWAQTKLGTPYLWGGNGTPDQGGRFDCSGLTKAAYSQAGIALPRVAQQQYGASGVHPEWGDLRPGDLVFFGTRRNLHHVGIYVGSGWMIHAPRTGARIRFNKVHYMSDYYGATRVAP